MFLFTNVTYRGGQSGRPVACEPPPPHQQDVFSAAAVRALRVGQLSKKQTNKQSPPGCLDAPRVF